METILTSNKKKGRANQDSAPVAFMLGWKVDNPTGPKLKVRLIVNYPTRPPRKINGFPRCRYFLGC
jgi:hypothetical protein